MLVMKERMDVAEDVWSIVEADNEEQFSGGGLRGIPSEDAALYSLVKSAPTMSFLSIAK